MEKFCETKIQPKLGNSFYKFFFYFWIQFRLKNSAKIRKTIFFYLVKIDNFLNFDKNDDFSKFNKNWWFFYPNLTKLNYICFLHCGHRSKISTPTQLPRTVNTHFLFWFSPQIIGFKLTVRTTAQVKKLVVESARPH